MTSLSKSDPRDSRLRLATLVQRSLLPTRCPQCQCADMAVRYLMLEGVGGDFYEFISFDHGNQGFLIGDVAGHGVESALTMAWIVGYVRKAEAEHAGPAGLIADLRGLLAQMDSEVASFCTAFYGIYDPSVRVLTYCNAGHPPPMLVHQSADELTHLDSHCLLVGPLPEHNCDDLERHATVIPGDRLALYTDGLTEVFNAAGQQWGAERLSGSLLETRHLSADKAAESILERARSFAGTERFTDDVTLIVIDFPEGRTHA